MPMETLIPLLMMIHSLALLFILNSPALTKYGQQYFGSWYARKEQSVRWIYITGAVGTLWTLQNILIGN